MYTADDLGFPVPEAVTEKSAAAFFSEDIFTFYSSIFVDRRGDHE